jgi:hypothetical protein
MMTNRIKIKNQKMETITNLLKTAAALIKRMIMGTVQTQMARQMEISMEARMEPQTKIQWNHPSQCTLSTRAYLSP